MHLSRRGQALGTIIVLAIVLVIGWRWISTKNKEAAITIGYRAHDLYAPLFVGIEQKIFEREGLTITPIKFESTNQLTDALLAKKIDAALGGVNLPLLFTLEEKSPGVFKVFSTAHETEQIPLSFLLVKKDSPIQQLEDLRGKKIGANPGSTMKFIYKKMISSVFPPGEATLVQMKPELELSALEAGQIDAAIVLEPYATIAQEKKIARVLEQGLFTKYVLHDMPIAASIIKTTVWQTRPHVARRLVAATNEAIEFMNTHPRETKIILTKYLPLDSSTVEKLTISKFFPLMAIDPQKMQTLSDVLTAGGELRSTLNVRTLVLEP